jgi:hypothetical protein
MSLTEGKVRPTVREDNDKPVEVFRMSIPSTEQDGREYAQCDRNGERNQTGLR